MKCKFFNFVYPEYIYLVIMAYVIVISTGSVIIKKRYSNYTLIMHYINELIYKHDKMSRYSLKKKKLSKRTRRKHKRRSRQFSVWPKSRSFVF